MTQGRQTGRVQNRTRVIRVDDNLYDYITLLREPGETYPQTIRRLLEERGALLESEARLMV